MLLRRAMLGARLLALLLGRVHSAEATAQQAAAMTSEASQGVPTIRLQRVHSATTPTLPPPREDAGADHLPLDLIARRLFGGLDWRLDQVSSPDDARCWNQSSHHGEGGPVYSNFDAAIWPLARRHATVLEFFQGSTDHGDICREQATGEYFCPAGCDHLAGAPWCGLKVWIEFLLAFRCLPSLSPYLPAVTHRDFFVW
jgi:hypothetical protein